MYLLKELCSIASVLFIHTPERAYQYLYLAAVCTFLKLISKNKQLRQENMLARLNMKNLELIGETLILL